MKPRKQLTSWLVQGLLSAPARNVRREAYRRRRGSQGRHVQLYHQVDDAMSHLLVQVMPQLADAYGLTVEFHVIGRPKGDVDPEPELRRAWATQDARELASFYQIEFPDGPALEKLEKHLPLAQSVLLLERGDHDQLAVAREVGEAFWAGDAKALRKLAKRHGAIEAGEVDSALELSAKELRQSGHYQGAMLAFEGEWYWGVERLRYLEERLRGEGLRPRGGESLPRRSAAQWPGFPDGVERTEDGKPVLEVFFSFRSPIPISRSSAATSSRIAAKPP